MDLLHEEDTGFRGPRDSTQMPLVHRARGAAMKNE
jgi:hypothetical protein